MNFSFQALVLRWRVGVFMTLGRPAHAKRWLEQALDHSSVDTYALATLAHVHAQLSELDMARQLLARCTELEPQEAAGWFNLGFVTEQLGRLPESEQAFRTAVKLNPKLDRAWYGLALVLIAQDRLEDAVGPLKINTELQPMSPHGWYQLARVQMDLGAKDEALRVIRRLQQFEPKVAVQLVRETGLSI